ncbi:MAG: metalloregulator ArsR/SmtB family transcription factor [Desulfonauticus sp.]|nr:metalloregulator ArsR/SmtB family transcription factor [Desulfonauticus sp.]
MKSFLKVMKALAEPNRVKIVKMLEGGEMCVCQVQKALNLSQPTISKHLKILEDAGLVLSRKQGMWVLYRLPALEETENEYVSNLLALMRTLLNNEPEIKKMLSKLEEIKKTIIAGRE